MLVLCILSRSFLYTVCSKVSDSHACHTHSVLFLPVQFAQSFQTPMLALCILSRSFLCSLLKSFRLVRACHVHFLLFLPMHSLLKSFRLSYDCHAHSALFLPMQVCSRVSDALSQAFCNLSLAFLVDFTLSDSTALIRFTTFSRKLNCSSFGSKDMITVFACLPSYRYSIALHCGHTFVGGMLPMNNRTRKERLSQQQNGR